MSRLAGCLAGEPQPRGDRGADRPDRSIEFVEHRLQGVAVAVKGPEQEVLVHVGRRGVPAVSEGVVDGPFQLRAKPEVAQRSAGAEVPADRAGVEGVDRVRAELRFYVAADLVEVDAEGGQPSVSTWRYTPTISPMAPNSPEPPRRPQTPPRHGTLPPRCA